MHLLIVIHLGTVFLDISKAFSRVWLDGLIYKIKCIGMNGMFLKLIVIFLENRFQKVVLDCKKSSWEPDPAGVPQGSVLGTLFFLIYITDLSSNTKLFTDDTVKMLMFPQIN